GLPAHPGLPARRVLRPAAGTALRRRRTRRLARPAAGGDRDRPPDPPHSLPPVLQRARADGSRCRRHRRSRRDDRSVVPDATAQLVRQAVSPRPVYPQGPPRVATPADVEGMLGRGGMGAVFLAHDTILDRAVALKLVRIGTTEDSWLRFLSEAHAL